MSKVPVAIIGSGNIATDLLIKIQRTSPILSVVAMVGIDQASEGLARARSLGVVTTHSGIDGLCQFSDFEDIRIVFDATSAGAHRLHSEVLLKHGKRVVDLTPAAVGPFVVPSVNIDAHLDAPNINMVTCGGQATIPIVAAVTRVTKVYWAEIVASIASKSAGPGTRANIDEFTRTTGAAIESVGGAARGKAIVIMNPADPPLVMRDTVVCLCGFADAASIVDSIESMVADVKEYVPGYRLKQAVQIEAVGREQPIWIPELGLSFSGLKVAVFLEVEGAGHFLPAYAGNLDIMTSAAQKAAERVAHQYL